MKKSTQAKKENLESKEDITGMGISQKKKDQGLQKLTKNPEEHWDFEEEELDSEAQPKRKIRQSQNTKKIMGDPWSIVPHTPILSRKIATGAKIKGKNIQMRKITSVKNFLKKKSDISIQTTQITKRKAKQINLITETLPQLIRTTLKDYNSINFKTQAS
ncbi:MAG: hypothetical protein LBJ13_03090 [Puniceicoccales bacterium]|jgi:hypothetical protein|nr:hypothetical protein [Puniceicoccales bacterium]